MELFNQLKHRLITMSQYYSLVTKAGFAAEATARSLGQLVNLTEFAVGDSSGSEYDPTGDETALKNERYRGVINDIIFDPKYPDQFTVEGVVPQNTGGFTIREAAIYTSSGVLYGIAKYPPSFKTAIDSGASSELKVRFVFATSNSSSIKLFVDPSSVLSTRSYVDNSFSFVAINQTSNALNNKSHIFTAHADLLLKAENDGSWVNVSVDDNVDLKSGDCRVKAPTGEKIKVNGKLVDYARFTVANLGYRFKRINGVWKV